MGINGVREPDKSSISEEGGTMTFREELTIILNRYNQENVSDTSDFILATYLQGCLDVFNIAIRQRETWYGREESLPHCGTFKEKGV